MAYNDNGDYISYSDAKKYADEVFISAIEHHEAEMKAFEEERDNALKKIDLLIGELEFAKQEAFTLRGEFDRLKAELASSKAIQLAEKEILIKEIEQHTATKADLAEAREAMEFCVETLKKYHPVMNPDEPCIFFEMWAKLKAALAGKEK